MLLFCRATEDIVVKSVFVQVGQAVSGPSLNVHRSVALNDGLLVFPGLYQ